MEIKNIITIDNLTTDSVSVKTQRTLIEENGSETPLGSPSRKAYVNSENGRIELAAEVPEPYFSAVIAVWGDIPTIVESDIEADEATEE